MSELPDWDEVDTRLVELDAPAGAAECHGMLCGLLCAPAVEPATAWLRDALGREPDQPPPPPLDALFRETLGQLEDAGFQFGLLLPPDDVPLDERTEALADWCGGFVYGLGAGGVDLSGIDGEAAEFLADVAEIGRAELDSGEADDDGEGAYAELVEYLRIGTLTLRTTAPERQRTSVSGAQ